MKQVSVSTELDNFPVNFFYKAIYIYLKKSQVVNRKLSCSANVVFLKLNCVKCDNEFKFKLVKKLQSCITSDDVNKALSTLNVEFIESVLSELKELDASHDVMFLSIDRMIPRNLQKYPISLVATFINTNESTASFHTLSDSKNLLPSIVYQISYAQSIQKILLSVDEQSDDESYRWLQFVLFKKIQRWMESCSNDDKQQIESHQLIDSEVYNETYALLKEKYGQKLEENWNESTDPKKFIYEDIAIASYLIVLWKQEREKSFSDDLQSFVDLGCGNGLLVYILSQEGHKGSGIDLRKRKIWNQFPIETDLREMAIIPSDENLFSDVDWIIGNHSDELSPWIPVISARSSFTSKYFLLPCCAFEFSGAKYQRKGSKSQYLSFIDYLLTVSSACGFAGTQIDRLKIPSTKRICLIGDGRNYAADEFQVQCQKIQNFINESNSQQGSSDKWSETFTPREKVEVVRNCSKILKSLCESIVKRIFDRLMEKEIFCDIYPEWNCGGEMTIPEAVQLVTPEDLKKLKSECGGLQTLLRNKHQIFQVNGGSVRIRIPKKLTEMVFSERTKRRNVVKTSPCYFYENHESSCPLQNTDCSYIHL